MESKKEKKSEKKVAKASGKKAAKKAVKKQLKKAGLEEGSGARKAALMMSPYLNSILDAVNNPGAKIPDAVTTPSYTFQALTRFTVTATTGAGGGNVGCGFYRTLGNTSATAGQGYATLLPGAAANGYALTGVVSPWASSVTGAMSVRVVSAKALVKVIGSPDTAAGRMFLAFLPPMDSLQGQVAAGGFAGPLSLTTLQTKPILADVPVPKGYAEVRYIPIDPLSNSYEPVPSVAIGTLRNPASANYSTFGSFIGIFDGCPAGYSFEVEIWENYEALPLASLVNYVQPTPSHSDPLEMAATSNVLADVPTIPVLQDPAASITGSPFTAPAPSGVADSVKPAFKVKQGERSASMMDKLIDGLGAAGSAVGQFAPLAASIASLL